MDKSLERLLLHMQNVLSRECLIYPPDFFCLYTNIRKHNPHQTRPLTAIITAINVLFLEALFF